MKRPVRPKPRPKVSTPGFACEEFELQSFSYVARALGFWARQMGRVACETCGVFGAVQIDVRNYAVRFDCNHCAFEHYEVFQEKQPDATRKPSAAS